MLIPKRSLRIRLRPHLPWQHTMLSCGALAMLRTSMYHDWMQNLHKKQAWGGWPGLQRLKANVAVCISIICPSSHRPSLREARERESCPEPAVKQIDPHREKLSAAQRVFAHAGAGMCWQLFMKVASSLVERLVVWISFPPGCNLLGGC